LGSLDPIIGIRPSATYRGRLNEWADWVSDPAGRWIASPPTHGRGPHAHMGSEVDPPSPGASHCHADAGPSRTRNSAAASRSVGGRVATNPPSSTPTSFHSRRERGMHETGGSAGRLPRSRLAVSRHTTSLHPRASADMGRCTRARRARSRSGQAFVYPIRARPRRVGGCGVPLVQRRCFVPALLPRVCLLAVRGHKKIVSADSSPVESFDPISDLGPILVTPILSPFY
jgi:hypothetical protein